MAKEKISSEQIEKIVSALQQQSAEEAKTTAELRKQQAILLEILSAKEKILELDEKEIDVNIEEHELAFKRGQITKQELINAKIIAEGLKEDLVERKEILELQKELVKLKEQENELINVAQRDVEGHLGTLTKLTGIQRDHFKNSIAGGFLKSAEASGDFGKALKHVGATLKDTYSVENIVAGAMQEVITSTTVMVRENEGAVAGFNKTTGAAGKYDKVLVEVGMEHRSLGISTEDAVKALESLKHQFTDFTKLDKQTQKELTELSATMEKFGVSVEDTAANIQFATKVMGLNTSQAGIAMREIAATAGAIGETPQKLAAGFKEAAPQLAAFGDKAIDKFKELAVVAKNTGLEMGKLLDLAGQFDTFEGAAGAVGKLNAILGGNFLDSLEMVNATDPAARIEILRGALDQAGKSFDQMSYYERKAIAEAAGLKGVDDLAKLMTSDINDLSAAAKEEALSQEEMNKMAKAAQSVMDKMKQAMMSFALSMEPVITWVKDLIDGFLKFKDATGPLIPALTIIGAAFMFAYKAGMLYRKIQAGIIIISKGFAASQNLSALANQQKAASDMSAAKSANIQAKAAKNQAIASSTAATGLMKLGVAIALVGAGVFLAAFGISLLADSLKGMTAPEFIGLGLILVGIGIGIRFLATAALSGSVGLAYLALVIGVVGAAIFLVTLGITMIVKALTGFFTLLIANIDKLFMLSVYIGTLALALGLMLPGAIAASLGIAALSVSLLLLAGSLLFIKTDDLKAMGTLFSSIAKISFDTADALSSVASSITEVAEALEKVPEKKAMAFASTIRTTAFTAPIAAGGFAGGSSSAVVSTQAPAVSSRPLVIEIGGSALQKYILEVVNGNIEAARR